MAAVTILSLIAFVFLTPAMMSSVGGPGGREAPAVRTTKFGNLGRGQLRVQVENRRIFLDFLQLLGNKLATNSKSQNVARTPMAVARVIQFPDPNNISDSVANKWLFAREAEAMGIAVDNKTVSDFLGQLTGQSLGRQDILDILAKWFGRGCRKPRSFPSCARNCSPCGIGSCSSK